MVPEKLLTSSMAARARTKMAIHADKSLAFHCLAQRFPRKRVMELLPRIVEPARWLKDRQNSSAAMGAAAKT